MRKTTVASLLCIPLLLAFGVAAWAQEKEATQKPAEGDKIIKIIPIKYADPNRLRKLLLPFAQGIFVDDNMRVLTVTDKPAIVATVEEAVKQLDVPPAPTKNVEITAYILSAGRQPSQAADLPPALNDVVAELKKVMNFQTFHLTTTAIMRVQNGKGGQVKGTADANDPPDTFTLGLRQLTIGAPESQSSVHAQGVASTSPWVLTTPPQEKQTSVHVEGLGFSIQSTDPCTVPHLTGNRICGSQTLAEIRTDIDIANGQKVVVGKTSLGSPDNALILVLTAKVMD